MPVTPLYMDKDLLLNELRMKTTSDTETLLVIDQAIKWVRLQFYRRLTLARALEIAALASVENPTTADENLRSTAEVVETDWVRWRLVCLLPHMTIETENAIRNIFEDVPLVRDAESMQKYLRCLKDAVEIGLGQLEVPIDNNAGDFAAFSTGAPVAVLLQDSHVGFPCR